MREDKLQSARYEFKYLVTDRQATRIREFVLLHLEPDDFTAGKEGEGYAVHSFVLGQQGLLHLLCGRAG